MTFARIASALVVGLSTGLVIPGLVIPGLVTPGLVTPSLVIPSLVIPGYAQRDEKQGGNPIAVLPPGTESDAKRMNSDLDKGIESNLHAALIQQNLDNNVKYSVKNNVVTPTGDVNSESNRARAQAVASTVPNVQQVVNELQVKAQKATSSN